VVGVQVTDEDEVNVEVVKLGTESPEGATAAVEHQHVVVHARQIAAACAPHVLPRR
jgi:hypothetical protein